MSTRFSKEREDGNSVATGYEGYNIPEDLYVPSCTIEDVDRAVFNLFNKDLPLIFEYRNASKRIPVIFATGERFAVLRRKRPLRDKHGALVLPLVSIMRSGIAQDVDRGMGPGQNAPIVVRKRLSPGDAEYQQWLNKLGLQNQDNRATDNHFSTVAGATGASIPAVPGTIASKKGSDFPRNRDGRLLDPTLGKNVFEIITLPPTKFFNASYEVTMWAQYTQQMNDMIMGIMSSYQNNHRRTFKLETDKKYWFVAYVDSEFSPGSNYDDFTDEERLVKYTFTMSVPAYVIASDHPGAMNPLRRFISAPSIQFSGTEIMGNLFTPVQGGPPSGYPDSYLLNALATVDSLAPGDGIGSSSIASAMNAAGYDTPGGSLATPGLHNIKDEAMLGGSKTQSEIKLYRVVKDPFTGQSSRKVVRIKSKDQRSGETVFRGGLTIDLGDFC